MMIVEVNEGKLEGTTNKSILSGKEYYSFLGIPYAKPPIGELRFQPPVPLERWDGILDAKKEGSICLQFRVEDKEMSGSEDCLFLNVYTPEPPSKIKIPKPVMVFIHGGAFAQGSGGARSYGADYLISYDVIFVTLNYRVNSLGFLNLGIRECPGNCGIKDQLLALKWIKKNISRFGGDSNNITIFGESAGASSVHLHMIAPSSKGLFNKAIIQSGTVLAPWSVIENPIEKAFKLGQMLGFEGTDPKKLSEFLKKQSGEDLLKATQKTQMFYFNQDDGAGCSLAFAPSLETFKENAFLADRPEILMKTAEPVPLIAGFNDKEGRLILSAFSTNLIPKLSEDFSIILKHNTPCPPSKLKELSDKVKEFYLGNKPVDKESSEEISDLFTDIYFMKFYESIDPIIKSKMPAYVYEFSFHGKYNFFSKLFAKDATTGAAHADDLLYLFFSKRIPITQIEDPEKTVINNLCAMWTNFAKTGNPTYGMPNIEWKPSTTDNPYYLRIDKDLTLVQGKLLEKRFSFWKNLLETMSKN